MKPRNRKSRTQLLADRAAGWLFYAALGVAAITPSRGSSPRVQHRCSRTRSHSSRHRVPARALDSQFRSWSRSTPDGCPERDAHPRPDCHGGSPEPRYGDIRQDRTLTKGRAGCRRRRDGRRLEERAFEVAAGVEGDSEHMIARAIRDAAEERDVQRASAFRNFENFSRSRRQSHRGR